MNHAEHTLPLEIELLQSDTQLCRGQSSYICRHSWGCIAGNATRESNVINNEWRFCVHSLNRCCMNSKAIPTCWLVPFDSPPRSPTQTVGTRVVTRFSAQESSSPCQESRWPGHPPQWRGSDARLHVRKRAGHKIRLNIRLYLLQLGDDEYRSMHVSGWGNAASHLLLGTCIVVICETYLVLQGICCKESKADPPLRSRLTRNSLQNNQQRAKLFSLNFSPLSLSLSLNPFYQVVLMAKLGRVWSKSFKRHLRKGN